MKVLKISSYLLALVLISSCNSKPSGNEAEVSEAKEVEEVEISAVNYVIDTTKTVVTWIGSKPAGKHNGTIPVSSGNIAIKEGAIIGGTINIDIAGIKNSDLEGEEKMQGDLLTHLKSPDFFAAEEYPSAQFVLTSVDKYSSEETIEVKEEYETEFKPASASEYIVETPTHKITGNLTMRGTTLSVAFPAHVEISDNAINASAKFNIDRTKWGLSYGDEASVVDKAKDKFIYNTVNVGFEISAALEGGI